MNTDLTQRVFTFFNQSGVDVPRQLYEDVARALNPNTEQSRTCFVELPKSEGGGLVKGEVEVSITILKRNLEVCQNIKSKLNSIGYFDEPKELQEMVQETHKRINELEQAWCFANGMEINRRLVKLQERLLEHFLDHLNFMF